MITKYTQISAGHLKLASIFITFTHCTMIDLAQLGGFNMSEDSNLNRHEKWD